MCVCFPFSLFLLFFFDSRVFTPSRHAQITSRLKSRKIFGKIVFFRYDNNFSPFKVRIFNGLIFISYWYNSIGSFLRSLSERKKKKRSSSEVLRCTSRRQRVDRSVVLVERGRHSLTPTRGIEGNWFKDKLCKAARGGNRYQVHCDRFQLPPLATREK